MLKLLVFLGLALVSGCANRPANVLSHSPVVCTLDGKAYVASDVYGQPFSLVLRAPDGDDRCAPLRAAK